jgi:hypothetical protein
VKFDKQKFNQTKLNVKKHHIVGTKQNIFVNDVVPKNKTILQNFNRNHRNKIKLKMLTQKLSQDLQMSKRAVFVCFGFKMTILFHKSFSMSWIVS